MAFSPYVFDASADNFNHRVLENSHRRPVWVHFRTPKGGLCFILMPRLARFDLLGSAHSLTRQYRPALSESLH